MGLLLLFIDGIGIGPPGPSNPLAGSGAPLLGVHAGRLRDDTIDELPAGWWGTPLDATLGVEGLPQSATGQTTLLSGVNAARLLGRHHPALPGPTLRAVLLDHSILKRVREAGRTAIFANAYGPRFFAASRHGLPRRASASTVATWASGAGFRTLDDMVRGEAVFHVVVRDTLREKGLHVPLISPEDAGGHLAALVRGHDFVFFEHFLSDLIGHGRVARNPIDHLWMLERFVGAVAGGLDPDRDGVVVTSDHGNLEDLSVTSHTRYPVPLLVWGQLAAGWEEKPVDLTAVTPGLLAAIEAAGSPSIPS